MKLSQFGPKKSATTDMNAYMQKVEAQLNHWHGKLYQLTAETEPSKTGRSRAVLQELGKRHRLARDYYSIVQDAGTDKWMPGRTALDLAIRDLESFFDDSAHKPKSH